MKSFICAVVLVAIAGWLSAAEKEHRFLTAPVGKSVGGIGWLIRHFETPGGPAFAVLVHSGQTWQVLHASIPKDIKVEEVLGRQAVIEVRIQEFADQPHWSASKRFVTVLQLKTPVTTTTLKEFGLDPENL